MVDYCQTVLGSQELPESEKPEAWSVHSYCCSLLGFRVSQTWTGPSSWPLLALWAAYMSTPVVFSCFLQVWDVCCLHSFCSTCLLISPPPMPCTRVVLTVGDTFLDLIRECTSAFLAELSHHKYYIPFPVDQTQWYSEMFLYLNCFQVFEHCQGIGIKQWQLLSYWFLFIITIYMVLVHAPLIRYTWWKFVGRIPAK